MSRKKDREREKYVREQIKFGIQIRMKHRYTIIQYYIIDDRNENFYQVIQLDHLSNVDHSQAVQLEKISLNNVPDCPPSLVPTRTIYLYSSFESARFISIQTQLEENCYGVGAVTSWYYIIQPMMSRTPYLNWIFVLLSKIEGGYVPRTIFFRLREPFFLFLNLYVSCGRYELLWISPRAQDRERK